MKNLTEITHGEFRDRQKNYDILIGEIESCSHFYELTCNDDKTTVSICLINNCHNMGLDPQIELIGNKLIVGNNESLSIINIDTREKKEYPVFPLFNKFFLHKNQIIVMSELVVFSILGEEINWSLNQFSDMIFFERIEDGRLVVSTYEDQKEITIDLISGKIL